MTIQLEIRPEVEAELTRRATLSGRPPETYAADLLEEALNIKFDPATLAVAPYTGTGLDLVRIMQRMPYKDEVNFDREPYYPPISDPVEF